MLTRNGLQVPWSTTTARTLKAVNGNKNSGLNPVNFITTATIQFGNGTTPPTEDDYSLESPVSGISIISKTDSITRNQTGWDEGYTYFGVYAIKNTNAVAVTITELGIYITANGAAYMLTRDVFSPTVLEPNEIYTFSVTIK